MTCAIENQPIRPSHSSVRDGRHRAGPRGRAAPVTEVSGGLSPAPSGLGWGISYPPTLRFDVGLFSAKKDKEAAAPEPAATPPESTGTAPRVKSVPTPKRRDAEAARRERLNPQLSPKEAKRRSREQATIERRKQMAAIDNAPGKVLMRNWVDSRFNLAELSMPILMAMLLFVLVLAPFLPRMVEPATYGTWAFMVLIGIDITRMWRGFKKLAAERIPREPLKGLLYYGFNRSLSLRRLRMPRPVLKRGDTF